MKYAVLYKNKQSLQKNKDTISLYQWLNIFEGGIIFSEDINLLEDSLYDLIHVRIVHENLDLIHRLKTRLGDNANTKIVTSLDIPEQYWDEELGLKEELIKILKQVDFVFGTTYQIVQALQRLTDKNVYEIPHPLNTRVFEKDETVKKTDVITIIGGKPDSTIRSIHQVKKHFGSQASIRVLFYRYQEPDEIEFYQKKAIDFIICKNEKELCARLSESQLIIVPEFIPLQYNEFHNFENLIIYSAALGLVVIGSNRLEAICRCYSELARKSIKEAMAVYQWIINDEIKIRNVIENAKVKAEYYTLENAHKRLLDKLHQETGDERFDYNRLPNNNHKSLFSAITHLFGNEKISYHQEEFIVVCLVKNGAVYIRTFLRHYRLLGAKHFIFIDNGSTDNTIDLLKQYHDVTIYKTELPHKKYECEIRRLVIEEHCKKNWCLCVDIDELFDYPYSKQLPMKYFLRYLNAHQYTAVLSYMLDMFCENLEFDSECEEDLIQKYCYFDISSIVKTSYQKSFVPFSNYNTLSDKKMKNYSGGIRRHFFRNKESGYLLTKHPLIFINSKTEPFTHPHFCNKVKVADVNGLLKHYKFIASFKKKVVNSLANQDFCYYAEQEYKQYLNVIKDKNNICLYTKSSERLDNIEQLIQKGFLRVSKPYRKYVKTLSKNWDKINHG